MPPQPLSRRQLWCLAGVTTLAAALRLGGIGEISLSHMDEGGYVASAMLVASDGPFSVHYFQPIHAPPLFPMMIGGVIWLTGQNWPLWGVLVSALLGLLSVPLLFFVARRWGGNALGLSAAGLLAISDFHIAYSRLVLTDVPLTFWFLLTYYFLTRLDESCTAATVSTMDSPGRRKRTKACQHRAPGWLPVIGWGVAMGLAAAGAWNTKYNGWLVLATIGLFAAARWGQQRFLAPERPMPERSAPSYFHFLAGLSIAVVVAAFCYLPWYLYVERNFPGGYAAVTENHRTYFSSPKAWPFHAYRLVASLGALRHYGWLLSLGLIVGMVWRLISIQPKVHFVTALLLMTFFTGVTLIQGGDATCMLLGVAGIVPALLSKNRYRFLTAIWGAVFVILTPLYHPYPRLMLPAMPAFLMLAIWPLKDVWPELLESRQPDVERDDRRLDAGNVRIAGGALLGAALASLVWLLNPHPLGLLYPSAGVWSRWTARNSYRAAAAAAAEKSSADAFIICQTQLAMVCYSQQNPVVAEDGAFAAVLEKVPEGRECLLAVDYSWLYEGTGKRALEGIRQHEKDLSLVAVIPNDLCIVTLLDHLSPEDVAAKLDEPLQEYFLPGSAPPLPLPPPISAPFADTIVLYRVRLPLSP